MIGFFDSWFGGLQTMKYFVKFYPEYDYIFLADAKNCPYGNKSGEDIKKHTFKHLNRLFDQGAKIVIVACNTAAAYAIRDRQTQYPDKKALSITIPGIEEIVSKNKNNQQVGILATQATVSSGIYTELFERLGGDTQTDFHFVMAPKLVEIVERGYSDETENEAKVQEYLEKLPSEVHYLILGCTHFPVLEKHFTKHFHGHIIDPSREAAKKFWNYLRRHPEISQKLTKTGTQTFYTTGNPEHFTEVGSKIFGEKIKCQVKE